MPLLADRLLAVVHRVLDAEHEQRAADTIFFDERVGEIELERGVTAFVITEMPAVAPGVGEKIRGADREDDAFVFPDRVRGNFNQPAVPTHFITRGGAMIFARDFERIAEDKRG